MAENSKISWTNHTWNGWIGCSRVSEACRFCYAEELMDTRFGRVKWGPGQERSRTSEANWKKPLAWNRKTAKEHRAWLDRLKRWAKRRSCPATYPVPLTFCAADEVSGACGRCGDSFDEPQPVRPRVFSASLADWLDDDNIPIKWLADLLALIYRTQNLDWLLLTKRLENWCERLTEAVAAMHNDADVSDDAADWVEAWLRGDAPSNVWLGTTVEDQCCADERIPLLLEIPARVRFLSCEPLLGKIDLHAWEEPFCQSCEPLDDHYEHVLGDDKATLFCSEHEEELVWGVRGIHWVICGGESGPKARPMHPDWARALRDQCQEAGVSFFMKQMSGNTKAALKAISSDLMIRETPNAQG